MKKVEIRFAKSFDDPSLSPEIWTRLLSQGSTNVCAMTRTAQRLWWEANERKGDLKLLVALRGGEPVTIAPMFVQGGMAFNLCPVSQLDLVGDVEDLEVARAILEALRDSTPEFAGVRLYFVPDTSPTGCVMGQAAADLALTWQLEDELPAPYIDMKANPDMALASSRKKTVLRRENYLRREGSLEVHHYSDADEILPQLDSFYQQHVSRWAETETPSRFREERERRRFRVRMRELSRLGYQRFSRLDWNGRPIAYHEGVAYQGRFEYGKTSYEIELAHASPGAVLLRHLILSAIAEGASVFDLGPGAEDYKFRYTKDFVTLQTWAAYPRG